MWEVRPTNGADTNGGGFVAGAAGTDWSNQNSPQYPLTNGVATTGSATIATTSAVADMVGNIVYVAGGTGSITGAWYQILSQVTGVSITMDRSTGLVTGTGVTLNIGGALKTISKLTAVFVSSNKAFVKAEATITLTATNQFASGISVTPSETVPRNAIIGYTTTRGDGGQVSITLSTNSALRALRCDGTGWLIDGFNIDCASLTTSIGIFFNVPGSNYFNEVRNCKIANFTQAAILGTASASNLSVNHCELTGGTSAATAAINAVSGAPFIFISKNWIHDNACPTVAGLTTGCVIRRNVISNNTGASTDGIQLGAGATVVENVIYKNGRHGIFLNGAPTVRPDQLWIRDNIITDHTAVGAAGLKSLTAAFPADPRWDGNAYYNNTTNRVNMDDTSTNAVDAVAPYTNVLDVLLTVGSPFTAPASNDFTLNNLTNQGALVRSAFGPKGGTLYSGIPGLTTLSGYQDAGVYQHQDPVVGPVGQQCT